jgi:tRNA threonylcarbamoyl adenosine modification protein YjeE
VKAAAAAAAMLAARTTARGRGAAAAVAAHANHRREDSQQQLSTAAAKPACAAQLVLMNERGTAALAKALASDLRAGDAYLLRGAVGAGKSAFSRAFVRAAAGDPGLPVPSPTFLLQQVYDDHEGPPIHHFDLYRLDASAPGATARLDLPTSFTRAVSLIEWPERLAGGGGDGSGGSGSEGAGAYPAAWLELSIEPLGDDEQRRAAAAAAGAAETRAASSSNGSSSGGSSSFDDDGDGDGADTDDDDDDPYADRRWRRVSLRARGAAWQERLAALVARAAAGGLSRHIAVVDSAV